MVTIVVTAFVTVIAFGCVKEKGAHSIDSELVYNTRHVDSRTFS